MFILFNVGAFKLVSLLLLNVAACRGRAAETLHDEDLHALLGQSQIQETQAYKY
jgi:hypothetical protein